MLLKSKERMSELQRGNLMEVLHITFIGKLQNVRGNDLLHMIVIRSKQLHFLEKLIYFYMLKGGKLKYCILRFLFIY